MRRRGLGGVKGVWVGSKFSQRGPGGFGLPFKNRFWFGLKKVNGLCVRNRISRRDKRMIRLKIKVGLIINDGLWV